jgi:cell division protein FtsZ
MATTRTSPRSKEKLEFREIPATISVIGVGGGGCNTVSRMMREKSIPGVQYICCNTDIKSLGKAPEGAKLVYIGERLTHGLGAGGDPEVGAQAAESGKLALQRAVAKSDLVFIATGLGGGTGTGAAPVVAEMVKHAGVLTVAIATTPFSWEGSRRMETAMAGMAKLKEKVDNLIVVHNDSLLKMVPKDVSMPEALKIVDTVVMQGIHSVAEVVNIPGDINVDLADVKAIMKLPGRALMAVGEGTGQYAAAQACQMAMGNPLINLSIEGAKGILFNVKGGAGLTLGDVNAVGEAISHKADPNAIIFFGMTSASELQNTTQLTVIATGIPDENANGRNGSH